MFDVTLGQNVEAKAIEEGEQFSDRKRGCLKTPILSFDL